MDYVQITDADRQAMLQTIGADCVEDLYANLTPEIRLKRDLDLPPARSELELQRDLGTMAADNHTAASQNCFLGGGCYDHFIPTVVNAMAAKGEFVTAYTPYQAEASQGSLQAFFEFQTQICRLTGLDVSNASMYEGASAVVEGVLMSLNVSGKRRVLVASTLNPQYRSVLKTYLNDLAVELIELPATDGVIASDTLNKALDDDTACVVIQSPNVFGCIEDWSGLFEQAHAKAKTQAVAVFNPIASSLLKQPGQCGADIAAGEGQPLGIPMQYGGPYLGLFAARKKLMRKMPGRLIGQTTDSQGRRGFCLTLQTREQHIRGAKATSNICTNQGLLALRATVHLALLGKAGIREAAELCCQKAHYAQQQLCKLPGFELMYDRPFFKEFTLKCAADVSSIIATAGNAGFDVGPALTHVGGDNLPADGILIAVTEQRTQAEIDKLVAALS